VIETAPSTHLNRADSLIPRVGLLQLMLLWLILPLTCGCARTAVVKFWQPASADVSDLDRIMVMDFTGDQGHQVASSLTGQLSNNNRYTVVAPTHSQNRFQLASFLGRNSSPTSLDGVLGTARSQGVDGVVVGDVLEYHCEDKPVRRTPFRAGQDMVAIEESRTESRLRRESVVREGRVTVVFRLVDVDSGEVREEHQVSHEFQQMIDNASQIPSQGEVLEQLTQRCLQDIVSYLVPHEATSEVRLAHCEPLSRYRREVREAIILAQQGKWDEAEQKLQAVHEKDPDNHAVLFNLAVVADHRQDYPLAEDYAMKALRIQYKECYAAGLEQIRAHRTAATKVNDQRDAQSTKIFAELW